jgi:hypothetical protein
VSPPQRSKTVINGNTHTHTHTRTHTHAVKDLESKLYVTEQRLARAEQMLETCQEDLSAETRQLLEDYRSRLELTCASSTSSSSSSSSSYAGAARGASGCESCEVVFSSSSPDDGGSAGALVPHPRTSASSTQVRFESCAHAHTQGFRTSSLAPDTRGRDSADPVAPAHTPQLTRRRLAGTRQVLEIWRRAPARSRRTCRELRGWQPGSVWR